MKIKTDMEDILYLLKQLKPSLSWIKIYSDETGSVNNFDSEEEILSFDSLEELKRELLIRVEPEVARDFLLLKLNEITNA